MKVCTSCYIEKDESSFACDQKYCSSCLQIKLDADDYVEYLSNKNKPKSKVFMLKTKYIEDFGGKCLMCGYEKNVAALDFHHLDATTKKFGIGEYIRKMTICEKEPQQMQELMDKEIRDELKKCVLLCKNCHMETHHNKSGKKTI